MRPTFAISVFATALLHVASPSQVASYDTYGAPCASRFNPVPIRVSGTLPVRGTHYTVLTRGPSHCSGVLLHSGTVNWAGIDLSPRGMTNCTQWAGPGATIGIPIVLDASGVAALSFAAPLSLPLGTTFYDQAMVMVRGANLAGTLTSNLGIARIGTEPDLTLAEIVQFAPLVRIHPGEDYFPMDPDAFVATSRLRHHRTLWSDQGYNRRTCSWVTTDSHHVDYYGVPVSFINAYSLHADGTNRRPRDDNSGDSWNVFLQPVGRPAGQRFPNGAVPAYYFYRRADNCHYVQYWWFSGFNDSLATFNHQGDWEHVTVKVVGRRIESVFFSAHDFGSYARASELTFARGRLVVYMAKGSHASYPTTGTWHTLGVDETRDGGIEWDTSLMLRALATQPWKDFAGAWGEVGATDWTTGPLGPWHKRNRPYYL